MWVVLYCESDDSHALVDESNVVYEDQLVVGDLVRFSFPGCKDLFEGIIKGFSDKHKDMVKLQDSLNCATKPKRDLSFHEGQSRRAAKKCMEELAIMNNKGKAAKQVKGSQQASSTAGKKQSVLGKLLDEDSDKPETSSSSAPTLGSKKPATGIEFDDDETDTNDDGSWNEAVHDKADVGAADEVVTDKDDNVETSSDDEEVRILLQKLEAKKKKIKDIRLLARLKNFKSDLVIDQSDRSTSGNNIEIIDTKESAKETAKANEPIRNFKEATTNLKEANKVKGPTKTKEPTKSDLSDIETSPKMRPQCNSTPAGRKRKRSSKSSSRQVIEFKHDGESLAKTANDAGVVKLWDDFPEVYISEKDLKRAKSTCGSASHLTRFLTRAVFTLEARQVCSVSGKQSMVKGMAMPEVRTKLNQDGVEAIIAFVQNRATKKHWKNPTESSVKQYMANVLCEDRWNLREAKLSKEKESQGSCENESADLMED